MMENNIPWNPIRFMIQALHEEFRTIQVKTNFYNLTCRRNMYFLKQK